MLDTQRRCFRCNGRKSVFQKGGGYTLVDTGGVKIDCPLCNGEGVIPRLEVVSSVSDTEKSASVTAELAEPEEPAEPFPEKCETPVSEKVVKPKKRMGRPPRQQSIFVDAEERN